MPYTFEETQAGEPRLVTEFPSLTSEVLTETFAQAYEENPVMAMVRSKELADNYRSGGKKLDAQAAREKLANRGMENDIKVSDAGITEDALDTLIFRKGIEKKRQEVFGMAEGGLGQGAARLGVALGTSLVDPIGVATAFIPVMSQARYTAMLGKAGSALGRAGVRAGVGALEGAAGAVLLEPLIAGSRRYEQADYDMADSLLNVAFGSVFGAGLHSVGGSISDGIHSVRGTSPNWKPMDGLSLEETQLVKNLRTEIDNGMDVRDIGRATESWSEAARKAVEPDVRRLTPAEAAHQQLPPIVRENVLKQAIVQAAMDEPVNVAHIVDAAAERQTQTPEFRTWFGGSKVVDESGQPLRVYHGTARSFDEFNIVDAGEQFGREDFYAYFSPDAGTASSYAMRAAGSRDALGYMRDGNVGPNVVPAFLSLKKPLEVNADAGMSAIDHADLHRSKLFDQVLDGDHDGIIVRDASGGVVYGARYPEGIKSAIGNSGRFDPSSASLTDPVTDPIKAASYAEKILAREVDTGTPTADALKMATEEASLAQSDLKALANRLGVDAEDAELTEVMQAAANADKWAKAAELATVCLVRGG